MIASRLIRAALVLGTLLAVASPNSAHGGPLLDWLRGKRRCYTPPAPAVASCGLQPGQCQTTCQQTCSRVVVNYVPCTAYRTAWEQVPVTQYKPVTNTDPCTGCSVTCMKPCTSYTWQMKQVPYTTYRPVYRTENYTVPVTYVTQSPACNSCAVPTGMPTAANTGCNSCGVPSNGPVYYDPNAPANATGGSVIAPQGTLNTTGSYGAIPAGAYGPAPYSYSPTPADLPPALDSVNPQSMQRPVLEQLQNNPGAAYPTTPRLQVPVNQQYLPPMQSSPQTNNLTVEAAPIRQQWDYTPVRLASYTTTARPQVQPEQRSAEPNVYQARPVMQPVPQQPAANAAWQNVGW